MGDILGLSDLASVGTLLSSIAVLVSLVYLGLQMRQNAKHTRALIHQGRAQRIIDIQLGFADPAMAAAIIQGNGGEPTPDAVRKVQFDYFCWATIISMEDSFQQRSDGLLSDDQFDGLRRGLVGAMSSPGVRAFWQATRAEDGSRFAAFVNDIIASLPPANEAGARD
jgi:hypothetical protein